MTATPLTRARLLLLLLIASTSLAQTVSLTAQDAWIRAIPGSDVAAVYVTLRNPSTNPVIVIAVQSSVASDAMIHETSVQGGQSRMRPHEQLVIPAGQTVKLRPGGLHVMLHGLTHPLAVGQSVPLVLTLAGGGTLQFNAAVHPLSAE